MAAVRERLIRDLDHRLGNRLGGLLLASVRCFEIGGVSFEMRRNAHAVSSLSIVIEKLKRDLPPKAFQRWM